MTTLIRTLDRLKVVLVALALTVAPHATTSAATDGSTLMLCAVTTAIECDATGSCARITPQLHPDIPSFIRVDVPKRMITVGGRDGRKSEIKSSTRLDGRLVLHGGESGRGWAATIAEESGRMSAGILADDFSLTLFGACTTP